MTQSHNSCHSMRLSHTAEQREQSWQRQHSSTQRGVKVWTVAVLDGWLMAVYAIPSSTPGIAVEGLSQVSKLCIASLTKLDSLNRPACMMFTVSEVGFQQANWNLTCQKVNQILTLIFLCSL